jgi:zinc transport system permease protein
MLDILTYTFMQKALLAGLMVGFMAPLLGVFVVARKASLVADTFAHTALAGVGLALFLGLDPIAIAVAAALLASIGIDRILEKNRLGVDAIQALFLSGGLALAVLLAQVKKTPGMGLEHYLFGSLLTVSTQELWFLLACSVLISVSVFLNYKVFTALSFNEPLAQVSGFKVQRAKTFLNALIALLVASSLKIVGGLLIGALMVIPVLTASRLANSFKGTLFISILISLFSVVLGLLLSYFMDFPAGSTIVLLNIAFFLLFARVKP